MEGLNEHKTETLANACTSLLSASREALFERGTPADFFLKQTFRANRKFGSRDRHFLTRALFAFYRWSCWLDRTLSGESRPEVLLLAAFACEGEIPLAAPVWCARTGRDLEQYRSACAESSPEARLSAFLGRPSGCGFRDLLPAWAAGLLADGAETGYLPYLTTRPPVWIRVQKQADRLFRELSSNGIVFEPHPRIANAAVLRNHAKINLYALESYRAGRFEVQDLSSQCIGLAASPCPGEIWWDACAGAGGKTLQMASLMRDSGEVVASDIRESRFSEVLLRAERGGFRSICTQSLEPARACQYDGVLVDAPCSSSGRWRRNPEMRLTASPEWIAELTETQFGILDRVAASVKPGGVLVYGTCSVFARENTGTVTRFLAEHPEFCLDPFPSPHDGTATDGMLQTFPAAADCDGSFAARFRKNIFPPQS